MKFIANIIFGLIGIAILLFIVLAVAIFVPNKVLSGIFDFMVIWSVVSRLQKCSCNHDK